MIHANCRNDGKFIQEQIDIYSEKLIARMNRRIEPWPMSTRTSGYKYRNFSKLLTKIIQNYIKIIKK